MYIDPIAIMYFSMFVPILVWAGILVWKWRTLPDFAGEVYDSSVEKGLLSAQIDRAAYIESFVRVEGPRAATYRCAAAFVSLLALPVLVSLFNTIWVTVWRWFGAVEGPYERGYMLHTFLTFVFVMAVIVGALYLVTAFYYRKMPPSLTAEIKRLGEESQ
ncbi:MAG: hypothetical protein AAGA24_06385 [Pseudomonadota bacterium]